MDAEQSAQGLGNQDSSSRNQATSDYDKTVKRLIAYLRGKKPELLEHFDVNSHPSQLEMDCIANALGLKESKVRVFFKKRRAYVKKVLAELSDAQKEALEAEFDFDYVSKEKLAKLELKTDLSELRIKVWFQHLQAREKKVIQKLNSEMSEDQQEILEAEFQHSRYISKQKRVDLALETGLSANQIKVWFQDRQKQDKQLLLNVKLEEMSDAQKETLEAQYHTSYCCVSKPRLAELEIETGIRKELIRGWLSERHEKEHAFQNSMKFDDLSDYQRTTLETEDATCPYMWPGAKRLMELAIELELPYNRVYIWWQRQSQRKMIYVPAGMTLQQCIDAKTSKSNKTDRPVTYVPKDDTVTMDIPPYAIPQTILHSFAPDGPDTCENQDEEITEEQEMVFQKVLKRKMTCDTCKTNVKRFKCPGCLTSICKDCITHECANCGEVHSEFMSIVLPEM